MEFRDLKLERSAGLTAADRKWMDDIVRDVNEGWSDDEPRSAVQYVFVLRNLLLLTFSLGSKAAMTI